MVRRNRLMERYLDIDTDRFSFPISEPFPDRFGNGGKAASAGAMKPIKWCGNTYSELKLFLFHLEQDTANSER